MNALLEVRSYCKRFTIHHLEREIPAFENLDFDLYEGQFMLVTGPNGAGKSTLLRCLFRTYLPSSGSALYLSRTGGINLVTATDRQILNLRHEEIGHVTQFLRARPRVSALAMVAESFLHRANADVTPDAAEQDARELLDSFGLKRELHHAYPTTFSGGEQQKVNLAHTLATTRRLILLDEPTASLDAVARAALTTRLTLLKEQGVAFIGVFHHPEDVRHLIDKEIEIKHVA